MSLLAAARLGARRNGADPSSAAEIALIAEDLCAELTPARIREAFRENLLSTKHPSHFEGEIDVKWWRTALLSELGRRANVLHRSRSLRLVRGGRAGAEQEATVES